MSQECGGETIVISGVSGMYPQSHNVKEFSDILYNKINPVTADDVRWQYKHPEVPLYSGKVPELDKFDAQFFRVHYRLGHNTDVGFRKLMEQAYQAIYDAGINPSSLSGEKVGVYVGNGFSESEKAIFYSGERTSGLGLTGTSKAMCPNRISYWLNAKAPSFSIDACCSGAGQALEHAYNDMRNGVCEAALVGGTHVVLHPQTSVHFTRVIPLAKDGKTKSFAENADGTARSEVISMIFLQKAKDALRIYANVMHVKAEFSGVSSKPVYIKQIPATIQFRDSVTATKFLRDFYSEVRLPPQAVEYVEACGLANSEMDKIELEALDEILCKDRQKPLLVGSVMSNIGYSETASMMSAITKVILGYEKGELAANLHCETPRKDISALCEGRMRILTEHQPFGRTYTAINSMSAIGINVHLLLKGHCKRKDINRYKTNLPYLVTISARYDDAAWKILNDLKSRPIDPEELALLHNIHEMKISGHLARGFAIFGTNKDQETVCLREGVEIFDDAPPPLWFVYSGMGSQWPGMGTQLMSIPTFAAAIERCQKALEPKGLDVIKIITTPDPKIFNNVMHSFVGIVAFEIALTDVLFSLGLVPDKIIGHSLGEMGCAYADGCHSIEELILAAYYRGLVSVQTPFIRGAMAAIGIGFQQISQICPPEIDVACHNGPDSCTISGPIHVVEEFVADLTSKGIFAKEVMSSNIAYHSRYIAKSGPTLMKLLSETLTPKRISERWLSTSVPKEKWNEPCAKYSTGEYHVNNVLNPVLFEEVLSLVPSNALLVEVSPHGLMQAILKRSLPDTCCNIPLTNRRHPDSIVQLLLGISKLFMKGFYPKISALYPKIEFPVSTETPLLSHLVGWCHDETWHIPYFMSGTKIKAAACDFLISYHDAEYNFLQGNIIRGQTLFPFAGALVCVWDTLAMITGVPRRQLPVKFTDVVLFSEPVLHDQRQLKLNITLHRGTGYFEVMNDISKVATGYILGNVVDVYEYRTFRSNSKEPMILNSDEVYQIFYEKDYSYSEEFCSIYKANMSFTAADLEWTGNWITFIDGMLQLNALKLQNDSVSRLSHIGILKINPKEHLNSYAVQKDDKTVMTANVIELLQKTRCGGVLLENVKFLEYPQSNSNSIVLKALNFIPRQGNEKPGKAKPLREYQQGQKVVSLQIGQVGELDSLHWAETPSLSGPALVNVHFAGLSNIDTKRASGTIFTKNEAGYGMDFSGVLESGERVMGVVRGGAASSTVRAQSELLWPVPAHWSLEDAATVPLPYAYAFYLLGIKCELIAGMKILVHGGTGALGQAVISIALANDCEVFATVSDMRKKHFLRKVFPALKDDHMGNSRDETFADMVLNATKSKRCDIVITCAKGTLKNLYFKCAGEMAITFDVSQIDDQENLMYGMDYLSDERSHSLVDFSSIFTNHNVKAMKKLQVLVSEGISRGYVRPLSRVTYAPHEATRAFRLLAASRHRGRVLLRLNQAVLPPVRPRLACSSDSSHLIICDGLGLGAYFADRLVKRGARKLLLHCSEIATSMKLKIRSWENLAVQVVASSANLFDRQNVYSILEECSRLGTIEGIYVFNSVKQDDGKLDSMINSLDEIITDAHSSVKFFCVINVGSFIGQETCISRAAEHLPATMLHIPALRMLKDGYYPNQAAAMSWRCAAEAIESALRFTHPILIAREKRDPSATLLQQVANAADVIIPESFDENALIVDLGIDESGVQAICTYLKHKHIHVSEDEVKMLTINRIREVEITLEPSSYKECSGLDVFFSHVDKDELFATVEIMYPTTLTNYEVTRDDVLDLGDSLLYIVPGLEGHHARFRVMCERLKLPAAVLQLSFETVDDTIQEMALRYYDIILKKTEIKDNFYLLGYESGVLAVLEIAAILEDRGLTGTIFCVGDGPDGIRQALEDEIRNFNSESELQNAVIMHTFLLITGHKSKDLEMSLHEALNWEDKVSLTVRALLGQVQYSMQYTRGLIEAAYARILQVRRYSAKVRPLRSRIVLLRAANALPQDDSLQKQSLQPVKVHNLSAPLAFTATDLRCAAIVNQYLDKKILQDFEKMNRCHYYHRSVDKFLMCNPLSLVKSEFSK